MGGARHGSDECVSKNIRHSLNRLPVHKRSRSTVLSHACVQSEQFEKCRTASQIRTNRTTAQQTGNTMRAACRTLAALFQSRFQWT